MLDPMLQERAKVLIERMIDHLDYPPSDDTKNFEVEMCVKIACALTRDGDSFNGTPEALADNAFRVFDRIVRNIPGAIK